MIYHDCRGQYYAHSNIDSLRTVKGNVISSNVILITMKYLNPTPTPTNTIPFSPTLPPQNPKTTLPPHPPPPPRPVSPAAGTLHEFSRYGVCNQHPRVDSNVRDPPGLAI